LLPATYHENTNMSDQFSLQEWANTPQEIYDEEEYFESEVLPLIYQLRDKCAARDIPMATLVGYANTAPGKSAARFVAHTSITRSPYEQLAFIQIMDAESTIGVRQGLSLLTAAYGAKPESPTH